MTKKILSSPAEWTAEQKHLRTVCCGNLRKSFGWSNPSKYPVMLIYHSYISDGANKCCIEYDFIYSGDI